MCGRYVVTKPVSKTKKIVKKAIGVENDDNYNAHPQQKLPVIKQYTNGKALEGLEWGMTPSWAKEKNSDQTCVAENNRKKIDSKQPNFL